MTDISIRDIIKAAGGAVPLAAACGVDRSTPYSWRQVPAEHVAAVSRATGIPAADLRPDLASAFA